MPFRRVASVLSESCPVPRSPSCARLHRQTVKPCVVSSSTYLFGWTDHGSVTASSGANPQTEAPRPSSVPCHEYDAPSVDHCIPVALEMCFTCKQWSFWKSPLALLHVKTRGSLAATVLTERKTLPEGSADLEILHQANRRGILPSWRGVIFQ